MTYPMKITPYQCIAQTTEQRGAWVAFHQCSRADKESRLVTSDKNKEPHMIPLCRQPAGILDKYGHISVVREHKDASVYHPHAYTSEHVSLYHDESKNVAAHVAERLD